MKVTTENIFGITYRNTRTVQEDVQSVQAFDKAMQELADNVSAN